MTNVIILCGGEGTRVKHILKDTPKALVEVAGRPHLQNLLTDLRRNICKPKIILATGVGHDRIQATVEDLKLNVLLSRETVPLGTGGAVKKCLDEYDLPWAWVINGDTIYEGDLQPIFALNPTTSTIVLSWKGSADRYGLVTELPDGRVNFSEKSGGKQAGWVNCGIAFVQASQLSEKIHTDKFSLETDFFSKFDDLDVFRSDIHFSDFGVVSDLYEFTDTK